MISHDIIVIGGGQMGLALGYYLRRARTDFLILDSEPGPGGTWRHGWDSLRLFSPAGYSSLPGWLMPPADHDGFPTRDEVIAYFSRYEERYDLPVDRPIKVLEIQRAGEGLVINTHTGDYTAKLVVSATGTWSKPYVPDIPGRRRFEGRQIHSADYRAPDQFEGQRVLVVGGGNSGAQIFAEVADVAAEAVWVTIREPILLPDDVDGRVLFERAIARLKTGNRDEPVGGIGNIVMVPPVKAARDRGILRSVRPFVRMTETGVVWQDGREAEVDAIIWCTGFRPALDHLRSLNVLNGDGRVDLQGHQTIEEPRLWLAGYGDWSGPGSATIMGAGRTARDLVPRLISCL
ncbi:SidA/IucD/PvdA family monooxygenase [Erythrobacter vulgaris]|uniref:SidA/IucD/PvdA family monooxygenase n=1 Tax=Qipengyuania vulgaris TaxID=291985 RepID=A0A844XU08_9SPHN|nr:ArsO family NAD(P)H-dependent flavin-containing monooxygenase [Qipengyuania vulgaris]MXO48889.1 SidA/IucD/PvdA family monooxygenase [Qipengyuania vulgaris]